MGDSEVLVVRFHFNGVFVLMDHQYNIVMEMREFHI